MEHRKVYSIIKVFLALALAGIVAAYCFFEWGAYFMLDKKERAGLETSIKEAPLLPDNFLSLYNMLYKDGLRHSRWYYMAHPHLRDPAPSARFASEYANIRAKGTIFARTTAFYFQKKYTPEECLSVYLHTLDFGHNREGIQAASRFYFKKPLKETNDDEMLALIATIPNPALYDIFRHPELVQGSVRSFKEKLTEQKNNQP